MKKQDINARREIAAGTVEESMPALLTVTELRDVYTRLAPFYGFCGRWFSGKGTWLGFNLAAVRDGEAVLEIGTGAGAALQHFTGANPSGLTIGVDLTPAMLELTVGRFRKRALTPALCQCDVRRFPFGAGSFDLVYSSFVLDSLTLSDVDQALQEIRRVLKPSGRIVLLGMSARNRWFNRLWQPLCWMVPNLLGGIRPIRLALRLANAGFESIDIRATTQWGMPAEVIVGVRGKVAGPD